MVFLRCTHNRDRKDEWGFTLPEVLITIVILGIILAIATTSWQALTESRQVDSAANQLASDLRTAHSSATNQLTSYEVVLNPGTRNYQFGPAGSPSSRTLPEGTRIASSTTVGGLRFIPNGRTEVTSGSGDTITVSSDDGSPSHNITFVGETSRIKVD